jgi:LPXTG-site transpeptidase (sortase) family protein
MNRNTNHKLLHVIITSVIAAATLLSMLTIASTPSLAAAPSDNKAGKTSEARLEIPSIKLNVVIKTAEFKGNTWDFSTFNDIAGYFQGLPVPGQHGNAVIGAHSELDNRAPGPFYNLRDVSVGDKIVVTQDGKTYTYMITKKWHVPPTDITPIDPTKGEVLTLLTCAGYRDGIYTTRLVVRAELVKNS